MLIEAVVFDLDGTLINSVHLHAKSWIKSFEAHGFRDVDEAYVESLVGLPGIEIVRIVLGEPGLKTYSSIRRLKNEIYLNYIDELNVYSGVYEVLNSLINMGLKLGIASSTPQRVLDKVLEHLNLKGFFKVVVAGDTVLRGKPDPEIYIKAFNGLEVNPGNGVIVGDTVYDIIPAKIIGSYSILVTHGRDINIDVEPNFKIVDITEVVDVVRKLIA
ncbi:MAG: HAD family hydrolase [Candidatus Methanomethylicia archaeon]